MKRLAMVLVGLCVAVVQAQTRTSTTSASTAQAAPTQVDSADHTAARYWGLTIDDYRRYQALMKGVRGAISDPAEMAMPAAAASRMNSRRER